MNEQWTVYTGISHEQGLGWAWRAAVHPDDLPGYQKCRGTALTTGLGYETEYRMKRRDGHYRWQLVRVLPLKDDQGKIIKWFGTCTDIDEQKRTQPALPGARTKDGRLARNRRRSSLEQISPQSAIILNSKTLQ